LNGLRVLRGIAASAPRYLALTGFRLLNENWDNALGDFRPINPRLPPFDFSAPLETLAFPPAGGGRPDRCLMVWRIEDSMRKPIHAR